MVLRFYTTFISVDLVHHEIFHAKVGKGGINTNLTQVLKQPYQYSGHLKIEKHDIHI